MAVSYCAFPSPTCAACIGVKEVQPCIEETLLVIGFFAKIVGSAPEEREERGGQLTAASTGYCSFPTREAAHLLHLLHLPTTRLAGTLHDTHCLPTLTSLRKGSFQGWWKLDPILALVCSLIQKVIQSIEKLTKNCPPLSRLNRATE